MFPLTDRQLAEAMERTGVVDVAQATIRQIAALAAVLEQEAGEDFIHLEIGNPGLPAEQVGIEAQCAALHAGCANQYPNIGGIPEFKDGASRFLKAFFDVDVPPRCIIPTVGSMQGSFTLQILLGQRLPGRNTILFLAPGFPAQQHQAKLLGLARREFDLYNFRGAALEEKLEEMVADGSVSAMIYSNPNNPAWTNLTEEELRIIARVADRHDIIIMEDLAYLGMDFRSDFSRPGVPPFIPTVAKYTDNYIMLVSGSKIFSYAGERIAAVCMSEKVYNRRYDYLSAFYGMPAFGDAYIFGVLYAASSGTSHSAQKALGAMFTAAAEGRLNFVDHCREYGRRAELAKKAFLDNGFHIVYDLDGDQPISDGFFFTIGYKGLSGEDLQRELIKYGVSTINLASTGSCQPGVRVTVSLISTPEQVTSLNQRLSQFHADH